MNIIIVGCGSVGYALAKNLSAESGVNTVIIDTKSGPLERAGETIDAMIARGDGLDANTLAEAGAKDADLLIAVMDADEKNILCCVLAKHLGIKHTAARVRTPEYAVDANRVWKSMGLDMIINPEQETAREISRLLRFPTADDIDIFVGGRVELVSFNISDAPKFFEGKSVRQLFFNKNMNVLLAAVERGDAAAIPHGDWVFEKGDVIRVLGRPAYIMEFFSLFGKDTNAIKNAVIVGGGKITYYLVDLLRRHSRGIQLKIIELNRERCETLSVKFPQCLIINGDGTDEDVLSVESADKTGAVVCLTDRDEENAVMALYSLQAGMRKVITKVHHIKPKMVKNMGIGSVVSPQNITSDQMIRYARELATASGDVKTVHGIFSNDDYKIEAVELQINQKSKCLDRPIKELKMKKGVLIGCIIRNANIIIPSGDSVIQAGDSVIVISSGDINELDDILRV